MSHSGPSRLFMSYAGTPEDDMTGTTQIDRYYHPGEPKAFGAG